MKMLVVNAGSSSLKFTVFERSDDNNLEVIAKGMVECIGLPQSNLIYEKIGSGKDKTALKNPGGKESIDHVDALGAVYEKLIDAEVGVIKDKSEIKAIGHRTVHGGEKVSESVLMTEEMKKIMTDCISLAPLHNPPNLSGIEACEKIFTGVPNVGVFDTAFHQTMKPEAFLYAIPYELYEEKGIRRYGFHGTSHRFVAKKTAEFLNKPLSELKLITCHIGNGASITAIKNGKVEDTSMGLTPLEGLMMGTRSGDIDPGVVFHLANTGMTVAEVDKTLNKKSGLQGIAGSSDMRAIIEQIESGDKKSELALKMFCRRIVKYIGAYTAVLNGVDAIIFTGGIGENSDTVREKILDSLGFIGVDYDRDLNSKTIKQDNTINLAKESSGIDVLVVPTDEELEIAIQSINVLKKNKML
ncbi:MAG: acetate kinase [Victivallales bacterium]|nr:acetate kinase [Victivallales bacterium]